ncbi:hypothetical protein [Streptomyces sp. NPDC041003]
MASTALVLGIGRNGPAGSLPPLPPPTGSRPHGGGEPHRETVTGT